MRYVKCVLMVLVLFSIRPQSAFCQSEIDIWNNFVESLRSGEIKKEDIRPYYESLREPIYQSLSRVRKNAVWEEWEHPEKIIRVGDRLQILVPLAFGGTDSVSYLFTLILENGKWHFQHMENVTIRLDKIESIPVSEFPNIPAGTKNWILEEDRWSNAVRFYNYLLKEKGREFALNWFKDGNGYFLKAKTWVPFLEPQKAFILYACWDQSVIRGNKVTLQELDDDKAVIKINSQFFKLYRITAHLRTQISFEDYKQIFDIIWRDRAEKAGWKLVIEYAGDNVELIFTK